MLDIDNQYRIIVGRAGQGGKTGSAGWRRRTDRGRLQFSGRDRIAFLQALVTNDLASRRAGQGVYAAYLTPQGRMVTDLRLYVRADHVIADVPASLAGRLANQFDQLIFSEDVQVTDVSSTVAQISVCGVAAAEVVATALGGLSAGTSAGVSALRALSTGEQSDAGGGFVARTDDATVESFDVFLATERPMPREEASTAQAAVEPNADVDAKQAAAVPGTGSPGGSPVGAFTSALAAGGAIPLSDDLAEALRIEAGRPAFTVDMTEDTIPLEAGLLERAISTTKGCYPGQEVVIRVLHRGGGRVAKRLVRLVVDGGDIDRAAAARLPGTPLAVGGREVGRITSAAWSPALQRVVALGYVHRDTAELGQKVDVSASPAATAIIDSLAS